MRKRFYGILAVLLLWPFAAAAQDCDAAYEAIVDLRHPSFGSYFVWDKVYGTQDDIERLVTGTLAPNGNAVAIGEKQSGSGGLVSLFMAEFDRRGRPVWEESYSVKNIREAVKMLAREKEYMVLANQKDGEKRSRIWIGFFSKEGKFLREKIITDNKFSLSATDIVESGDGKGYVLAAAAEPVGNDSANGYGLLYWLDLNGNIKGDRAYMPGLANRILNLNVLEDNSIFAAGYLNTHDGRKAGWALNLDHEGNILWQRQYPRGVAAALHESVSYIYPYMLVAGEAQPLDEGNRAAWLMLIDRGSGEIGWQRYYRTKFDMDVRALAVHEENQISLLMSAQFPPGYERPEPSPDMIEEAQKDVEYIRLLTLSPRGEMLYSDPYFQGEGAGAYDMFLGPNNERVMTGFTDTAYANEDPNDPEAPPVVTLSRNGWIVAGAMAEPYNDPCKKP